MPAVVSEQKKLVMTLALTLTLSPGEREQSPARSESSFGVRAVFALSEFVLGRAGNRVRPDSLATAK